MLSFSDNAFQQRRCTVSYRPGVSSIRGMLSSRGSLTISRKAEIPIWPFPMSSWRSRWHPRCPEEEGANRETFEVCTSCDNSACTFRVVEMDGFKVVEPDHLVELIQHGLHSPLCSQVIAFNNDKKQNKQTKNLGPDRTFYTCVVHITPTTDQQISSHEC